MLETATVGGLIPAFYQHLVVKPCTRFFYSIATSSSPNGLMRLRVFMRGSHSPSIRTGPRSAPYTSIHTSRFDSDDALLVKWGELTTTTATGKVVYSKAWVTSHPMTDDTVIALVAAGRSRWKIENENNNVLKTKGDHFEHNYGHSQHPLSAVLATLILLAYLCHTILDWMDARYQAVCARLPSRQTFFEPLRALLQHLPFDGWDQLMAFMLEALEPLAVNSG